MSVLVVALFPERGAVTTVVHWSLTVLTQRGDNLEISTNHLPSLQASLASKPESQGNLPSPSLAQNRLISFSKLTL